MDSLLPLLTNKAKKFISLSHMWIQSKRRHVLPNMTFLLLVWICCRSHTFGMKLKFRLSLREIISPLLLTNSKLIQFRNIADSYHHLHILFFRNRLFVNFYEREREGKKKSFTLLHSFSLALSLKDMILNLMNTISFYQWLLNLPNTFHMQF